ncbi:unnamed protein product [Urochloa decumbens]|uniref:F-box domain-containing protein n=1 Tax=Urochloa decumbens TaxID=240449 RepID=A0ABC8WC17_9POAL
MASSSSAPPPPPPPSGWASGLPRDVLWDIFLRIGTREILAGAGLVCSAWWRLARDEPALWRRVDLNSPDDGPPAVEDHGSRDWLLEEGDGYSIAWLFAEGGVSVVRGPGDDTATTPVWKAMARAVVERSAGRCESFWGRADDEVLLHLAGRAPSLRSLHVTSHYDVSSTVFSGLIKEFPLLEELELVLDSNSCKAIPMCVEPSAKCWAELLQAACGACSHLNRFTVRYDGNKIGSRSYCYQGVSTCLQAFVIPTMHELQHLQLFGHSFSGDVVLSIIHGCPNLQYLDIRHVNRYLSHWDIMKIKAKCSITVDQRFPNNLFYDSEEADNAGSSESESDDSEFFYDPYSASTDAHFVVS